MVITVPNTHFPSFCNWASPHTTDHTTKQTSGEGQLERGGNSKANCGVRDANSLLYVALVDVELSGGASVEATVPSLSVVLRRTFGLPALVESQRVHSDSTNETEASACEQEKAKKYISKNKPLRTTFASII